MNKRDWFFLQNISQAEMDDIFDDVEAFVESRRKARAGFGIEIGATVTLSSFATPVITINPGAFTDKNGKHLRLVGSTVQDIDTATGGASTVVAGGGNERYVSVFFRIGPILSDPRTDGNGVSVDFIQDDGLNEDDSVAGEGKLFVTVGAEAGAGSAVRPPLDADAVLVADFLRTNGSTVVTTDIVRTEYQQRSARIQNGLSGEVPLYRLISEIKTIDTEASPTLVGQSIRVYQRLAGGFALTNNASFNPTTGKWVADVTGSARPAIIRFANSEMFFGLRFDPNTPWDDSFNNPAGWSGLDFVTDGGTPVANPANVELLNGIFRVFTASGHKQQAIVAVGGDSGAGPSTMLSAYTYPMAFNATPASITLSTLGADANVTSAVISDSQLYGAVLAVVPTVADTTTRAVRRIQAD